MKRLVTLYVAAMFAAAAHAGEAEPPVIAELLAGVAELGSVNGTALACGYTDLLPKTKAMMLLRMPKTRRFGEAYEDASSTAFRAMTNGNQPCPEAVILALRLEAIDLKLQDAARRAGVQ